VPASGFYEWRKEGRERWPLYFQRADERPLAFAALWEAWGDIESCTIITTDANELMAPIHNRIPVILGRNDYGKWLDPDATDLAYLLAPCPADELKCHPVDRFVNKVANEGPQGIVPLNSL
jgi:putative SOS response-associated peptidase YedK